jgi:hypothetical protein
MLSTVYTQTINGEGLLCGGDARIYSGRAQIKKTPQLFLQTTIRRYQSCNITSLDESDITYYEVYNTT